MTSPNRVAEAIQPPCHLRLPEPWLSLVSLGNFSDFVRTTPRASACVERVDEGPISQNPPSSSLAMLSEAATSASAATFPRSHVAIVAGVAAFSQAEGSKPLRISRPVAEVCHDELLMNLLKRFSYGKRRHSSVGPERLICNCLMTFCAAFRDVAQSVFRGKTGATPFARRFGELRSFAAKNRRTVENDRERD
jgi:hypothetical protein